MKERASRSSPFLKRHRWSFFIFAGVAFILIFAQYSNYEPSIQRIDTLARSYPLSSWPTVKGTVISTQLHCYQFPIPEEGEYKWWWGFIIRFAYHVGDSRYSARQQMAWH
jgi:hypothetical protein